MCKNIACTGTHERAINSEPFFSIQQATGIYYTQEIFSIRTSCKAMKLKKKHEPLEYSRFWIC